MFISSREKETTCVCVGQIKDLLNILKYKQVVKYTKVAFGSVLKCPVYT